MKGKMKDVYVDAIIEEMDRLEEAGYDTEGDGIFPEVNPGTIITLPDGNRIQRYISNLVINHMGAVVAAAVHLVDDDGSHEAAIITDCLYDQLSPNAKRYVLAHEAGHIACNHLNTSSQLLASNEDICLKNRNIQHEYDADAYAASILGKEVVLAAMKELWHLMKKNSWIGFNFKELKDRIRHVKRLKLQATVLEKAG